MRFIVVGFSIISITLLLGHLANNPNNPKTTSYFVSYYTTNGTNGTFNNRVFVVKKLDVETLNRIRSTLDAEHTNTASVILSIHALP